MSEFTKWLKMKERNPKAGGCGTHITPRDVCCKGFPCQACLIKADTRRKSFSRRELEIFKASLESVDSHEGLTKEERNLLNKVIRKLNKE